MDSPAGAARGAGRAAAHGGSAAERVRALVLGGYGLNCDYETEHVFRLAGADPQRVHINELIAGRVALDDFHIFAFIGGFAWADDHGAGVVLATKLRRHLGDQILRFIDGGRYVIGICNGFQALVNLGILPGFRRGSFRREVALTYNDCGNFRDQWVHLRVEDSPCVFRPGDAQIELPVRHAEGKFVAAPEVLDRLRENRQIVLRYALPNGDPAAGSFPWNPNGSQADIAGICDPSGCVFGLMPHPEAYNHETNHPDWTRRRWTGRDAGGEASAAGGVPCAGEAPGVILFRNAVVAAQRKFLR
jgi:phosphoribosylformylglycinamidine synthase